MIILRYSELGLKGNNRSFFEKRLAKNIKRSLKVSGLSKAKVRRTRGRILVDSEENALPLLRGVFGITSLSDAQVVPPTLEYMKQAALEYAKARVASFNTFRITCQRINPKFPISSIELEKELGAAVVDSLHKKVCLKNPELNIQFEIADKAYLFSEKIEGAGGLPVGSEGKVIVLINAEEQKMCLLSAYLLLRRGCSVFLAGITETGISSLSRYSSGSKLGFHKVSKYEELDDLATKNKILGIAVPDRIGKIRSYPFKTMVLRPLVGYTEKELSKMADTLFG